MSALRTALLSALLVGCGPPESPEPADMRWVAGADLPVARQECGVVALSGRVILIGGFDDTMQMLSSVDAYDPAADLWEPLAALPEPLHHPNVAVLGEQIHVLGALGEGFAERALHLVYDPAADLWQELPEMPRDRAVGAAAVAVLDGVAHLVGGIRLNRAVALHTTYDPLSDRWEELPDAPHARDHGAAVASQGTLAVVAGRQGTLTSFVAPTDRFDVASGWQPGAPIPTPRGGVMAAADSAGVLSVLGGEGDASDPAGVFSQHERYDVALDAWERMPPMRTPRHGTGAAFTSGTLWVPGGADVAAFGAVQTNEGWTP